jgi:drug/metabolite transporter (DMT)-like permease
LNTDWLFLSLLCAFSLACADAATKAWLSSYSARELTLVRLAITGLLMSPLLSGIGPLADLPPVFWFWIAALVPLEMAAMLLYMRAIRDHPLSLTLPYLAFTPVFVILTGQLLLGEKVSLGGGAGILLVVAGAWLLNLEHADLGNWRGWLAPLRAILYDPGSRMMLGVALLYSLTSAMGKRAMQYMAPERFGAFYFVLLGFAVLLFFALPRPRTIIRIWRRPLGVLAVSLFSAAMVYTHFLALQLVEVAYMIAVKRTSLLFGILFGALFFNERGLGMHLVAGGLMLGGVFLIAS